jgi:hypothetical protein
VVGEQACWSANTRQNYWIINNRTAPAPAGCGVVRHRDREHAQLPEYAHPPTPTCAFAKRPELYPLNFLKFNYILILKWEDQADNETGYNLYVNDGAPKTLGPDVTQVPLSFILPPGVHFKFEVEAFNSTGASARKSKTVTCP